MAMRVNIHGIGRVVRNAEQFEDKIIKATRKAMIKSALVDVETGAKKKITQDRHVDTGRLRASIHTSYKGNTTHFYNDNDGKSFESILDVRRTEFNVFIGTDVLYAVNFCRPA